MSYRPALVKQLTALGFDPSVSSSTTRIPARSNREMIPIAVAVGVGTMLSTQLILRHRFGNV